MLNIPSDFLVKFHSHKKSILLNSIVYYKELGHIFNINPSHIFYDLYDD